MKQFEVIIRTVNIAIDNIEASSREEAEKIALDNYYEGRYDCQLNDADNEGPEIEINETEE